MKPTVGVTGAETMPAYHVHQSHIKEHASGYSKDPVCDVMRVLAHSYADQHANVGHERGQQVVDDGLFHRHPRLYQHSKITCRHRRLTT